jgi:hypothetical protein
VILSRYQFNFGFRRIVIACSCSQNGMSIFNNFAYMLHAMIVNVSPAKLRYWNSMANRMVLRGDALKRLSGHEAPPSEEGLRSLMKKLHLAFSALAHLSLCSPGWPKTWFLLPQPPEYWDYRCVPPHLARPPTFCHVRTQRSSPSEDTTARCHLGSSKQASSYSQAC